MRAPPPHPSRAPGLGVLVLVLAAACGASSSARTEPAESSANAATGATASGGTETTASSGETAASRATSASASDEIPPRPPPPEPRAGDPSLVCTTDADCALAPAEPCGCPPCGYVWRRAATRAHVAWLERQLAIESCDPPECEACGVPAPPGGWVLGTGAACERGLCRVQ